MARGDRVLGEDDEREEWMREIEEERKREKRKEKEKEKNWREVEGRREGEGRLSK